MDDLELEFVTVITRHGLRTPLNESKHFPNVWDCIHNHRTTINFSTKLIKNGSTAELEHEPSDKNKALGTCYFGQLTPKGIEQMKDLGEKFKERYINDFKLLKNDLEPSQLYIRSTRYKRTIETAQYVLEGMYEGNSSKEVVIHVNDKEEENMYPRSTCKQFRELQKEALATEEYRKFEKSVEPLRKQIQKVLNFLIVTMKALRSSDTSYPSSWAGLQNTLHTLEMHSYSTKDIGEDIKEQVNISSSMEESFKYKNKQGVRLGIGRFLGDVVNKMDEKVQGKVETSGHDNTLYPILHGLEISDGKHPKMGSYFALELFKHQNSVQDPERYIRIIYNDKLLSIPQCKPFERKGMEGLCPYSQFKNIVQPLIPVNYKEECIVKSK